MKLPNGETKSLMLTLAKTTNTNVYPSANQEEMLLDFKWIDKNIAYLALNSFLDPKINTLFVEKLPELYKAKALIVDLRENGGGNTGVGRNILKYLTRDTILYGAKQQTRLHMPVFKAWGKWVEEPKDTIGNDWKKRIYLAYKDESYHNFDYKSHNITENIKRVIVPTVLLTGHETASAAEDFLIYADNQKHMTKIGSLTFGSTGESLRFDLPGGGLAFVCTIKDTYLDGREFVGYGIQPDIEIHKTLKDYLNNNDPALNKAIEFLKGKK